MLVLSDDHSSAGNAFLELNKIHSLLFCYCAQFFLVLSMKSCLVPKECRGGMAYCFPVLNPYEPDAVDCHSVSY